MDIAVAAEQVAEGRVTRTRGLCPERRFIIPPPLGHEGRLTPEGVPQGQSPGVACRPF
jgi:hypothetical protein